MPPQAVVPTSLENTSVSSQWTIVPKNVGCAGLLTTDQISTYLAALAGIGPDAAESDNIISFCKAMEEAAERVRGKQTQQESLEAPGSLELAVAVMTKFPKHEGIIHAVLTTLLSLVASRPEAQVR
jgi:hypothetical protein